jgi:hypothetical protein
VPNVTNTYHLTCFPVVPLHRVVTFGTNVVVFCHLLSYARKIITSETTVTVSYEIEGVETTVELKK